MPGGANLNSRHPLRLNVGFLLNKNVGYSRIFDFDLDSVRIDEDLVAKALQGSIRLTRTAQGVYSQGRLGAKTDLNCVRCLTTFEQHLTIELEELFIYPPGRANDPILTVHENGILDLNPLLREYLLLDIPIQPLCQEDCKGLCPECGENLNDTVCDHTPSGVDPRMAALKSLLPKS